MKRSVSLLSLVLFLGGVALLFVFIVVKPAQAQIDSFTFFIPYPADKLDDQFDLVNFDNNFINDSISTTISIAIQRNNTIIYYDHWEDKLEPNLLIPLQPTTEIWGDNDPSNGIPPGFTTDALNQGSIVVLRDTIDLPRDQAQIFFDGGDKLTAVGGNIAVSLAVWTESASTLYSASWELYPTVRWEKQYVIPVGEDLDPDFVGSPYLDRREAFGVVGFNVQAVKDNTSVTIDLDGDGNPETSTTLNEGQSFTQPGGVRVSAQIDASAPVQIHLFTGNNDPGVNFEARAFTLPPREQWSNNYLAPRSSNGDYWLYNPSAGPLAITATTFFTRTVVTIPAGSVIRYTTSPTGGMSIATGLHFAATLPFYGLAVIDPSSAREWGYPLFPSISLTTQELIGWGPGNNRPTPDGHQSLVYVTALSPTILNVRYNDGVIQTFPITPLAEIGITVPLANPVKDLTGALLYTTDGTPFKSVWGQAPNAPAGQPSIDLGTSVVPLPSLAMQKSLDMVDDTDSTNTLTWGDVIRFNLVAYNNSFTALTNGVIADDLPPSVTYIEGSSLVDGVTIADDTTGATRFPFDEGGYTYGTVLPQQVITVTFEAIINEGVDSITNNASIDTIPTVPSDPATINPPIRTAQYELDKRVITPTNKVIKRGELVTYGLTITSTGNISITKLPLRDVFEADKVEFIDATPFPPDLISTGIITWSDLATATRFGPLLPGQTVHLTTTYRVKQLPSDVVSATNIITVQGAEGSDGSPLPPASDDEQITFSDADYILDKRVISPADGVANPGEVITYSITITSTGRISITTLPLRDEFDKELITFLTATPFEPDQISPGLIQWNNLAAPNRFGPLLPGGAISLITRFVVTTNIPTGITTTINTAVVEGAEAINNEPLPPDDDSEQVDFPPPEENPNYDDSDDDDGIETPSSGSPAGPPATAGSLPPPPAAPPSPFPVAFLPETGLEPVLPDGWLLGIALTLSLTIFWRLLRRSF